jgi:membrane associated rhomboid family serine protease
MMNSPRLLLSLGLILMITGVVIPFLILILVLESTFFLNFFSWGASVGGLFLGIIGVATWVRKRRE